MKRKKTRSVASYRAASLKGARTRKLMKRFHVGDTIDILDPVSREIISTVTFVENHKPQTTSYRALPNPWFDMVRK